MSKIIDDLYVDDLMTGAMTLTEAVEIYFKKFKVRFAAANSDLRKWRTNNFELRRIIEQGNDVDENDGVTN